MRLVFLLILMFAAGSARAAAPAPLILAFGDSLTAGFGLERGLGFAPQLQAALRRHGIDAIVADGGVSGDTSTAARARLGWTLDGLGKTPDLVIVELGANDMLRGLGPGLTQNNLDAIVTELKRRKLSVLLAGMRAARNLDPAYVARFDAIFPALARKHNVPLYPFFLDGAVLVPGRMQADGMHPSFEGIKAMVTRIVPAVKSGLKR